jgi:hypothetical protein
MTPATNDIPPAVRPTAANPMTLTEENPMTTDLKRWTPSDDMPLVVLDEAHQVLTDTDLAKLIADVYRQGRKAGVNNELDYTANGVLSTVNNDAGRWVFKGRRQELAEANQ